MNETIREMRASEYPLLKKFLYEAIFVPEGVEPPPKTIIDSPELQVYIDRFGELRGDQCFVAEAGGQIIGAVWVRIMNDYGHLDDQTPSFAIALDPAYRGLGIGTRLMKAMLASLKSSGYKRASLAVQKANRAGSLYQKLGFQIVAEKNEEYIMVNDLST